MVDHDTKHLFIFLECVTVGWNTQQHKETMHTVDNTPRCVPNTLMMSTIPNGNLSQSMSLSGNSNGIQKAWNNDYGM